MFVVVRAGEVVDRFASSLYLVTMRIGHLAETAAAQCFPRLFLLFAPPRRIDRGGPLDGPRDPKNCPLAARQRCFAYFVENRRAHTHRTSNPVLLPGLSYVGVPMRH